MGLLQRVRRSITERFQANEVIARLVPVFRSGKALPNPHEVLELARLGYVKNPIVGACVRALATSAAEPELEVVRREGEKGFEPVPETHPAAELLAHPNREQSQFELLNEFLTFYRVAGNAFLHKKRNARGRIEELWNLRPDRIKIVPGRDGLVSAYEYNISGTRKLEIPAADVIHMREPNPLDDYWGLSRVVQVAMYIDLDNEAAEWLRDFFENKGVVAAILKLRQKTTREQRRQTKEEWLEEYGAGSNRRHGLAVLGNDAEYQKIAESPSKELDLEHVWDTTESRICAIMDTPPIVVGLNVGLKRQTYSNYEQAVRSWWEETLSPLYRQVQDKLTHGLMWDPFGFDQGLRVRFNLENVEALQETQDSKHKRAVEGYDKGVLMRSEARRILGEETTPEDEVYKIKSGELVLPPGEEGDGEGHDDEESQHRRLPASGTADLPAIVLDDGDGVHVEPRLLHQ